jgi:hypothetical protein
MALRQWITTSPSGTSYIKLAILEPKGSPGTGLGSEGSEGSEAAVTISKDMTKLMPDMPYKGPEGVSPPTVPALS